MPHGAVSMCRQLEAEMNRAYALLIPIAFVFTACGPGELGDDCKDDDDCDTDAGHVCEFATDATEDEDGVCAEEMVDPV
jgi:hypothetical protein